MINLLFRLFLTFNATSLIGVIYLVKSKTVLSRWLPQFCHVPHYVSYLIYFAIPVLFTYLSLLLARLLDDYDLVIKNEKPVVSEIEQANNAYLPSYLGYFFVALSVPFDGTMVFVYLILFLFTFLSQTLYFNPLFLLFGYHFYYLTTTTNIKIFIITRKVLKNPRKANFPVLKHINDFTFIDQEK